MVLKTITTAVMAGLKKIMLSPIERTAVGNKFVSLYQFRHHLEEIGWFNSRKRKLAVDFNDEPLPWYTYPAIAFLKERVDANMCVFEYGSGNSTLWWADRVASLVSCEHDVVWFNDMKGKLPDNVEYRYCELIDGGQYCRAVSKCDKRFDIIVIDGRDRINCAKNSLGALADAGVIIWDNSDRVAYQEGFLHFLRGGFKRLDFWGYGPISSTGWCTSIFYREGNCLGI